MCFWPNSAPTESNLCVSNLGNAKIEGLEASLGMDDTDYNVAVAVFFVSYVIFGAWGRLPKCASTPANTRPDIPSNYVLSKFKRPSLYLGGLVVCWGIIMTLTGVVKNFGGLCATRFLLGVFEYAPQKHPVPPIYDSHLQHTTEPASSPVQTTLSASGIRHTRPRPASRYSIPPVPHLVPSPGSSPSQSSRWTGSAATRAGAGSF